MFCAPVSPPTWNIIGSCLLLSSSHWPWRCQSSKLTCETSLQLYTRAGGTSGLVVASYTEQGKKRVCYLCAYIVLAYTVWKHLIVAVLGHSGRRLSHLCAAGIIWLFCFFFFFGEDRGVIYSSTLWMKTHSSVFFMERRLYNGCLAWLWLLNRPPRARYGF